MVASQHRRSLPAVAFVGVLTVFAAVVWLRVLDRGAIASSTTSSSCVTPPAPIPTVLPKPPAISLTVLNATDRTGLAAKTRVALVHQGFKVVQATNDEPSYGGHGTLSGVGEIRYGPTLAAAAQLLRVYVPGAALVATDSSSSSVVLALGLKFTKVLSAAEVSPLLSEQHLVLVASNPPPLPRPSASC